MAVGLFEVQKTPATVTRHEFDKLCQQVAGLQKSLKRIERQLPITLADEISIANRDEARTPYSWGDSGPGSEAYYHRQDIAGSLTSVAPWVSTTVRFGERLTSTEFVKATAMQAGLLGITFTGLGAAAAVLFNLPWTLAPVAGVGGCALSAGLLVMLNRAELHTLIKGQADRDKRRRQELKIQVDKTESERVVGIEFLYVAGISQEQILEFAPWVLRTNCLSVNVIGGGHKLFSQPQAQALCAELEFMGYAKPARGPQGRSLSSKGRAFFKGLAEQHGAV